MALPELPLRERKKQRTRQAISDAATALFAERGFDAVTIDEVAAAAEVSKKTIFNYFGSKEDLLFDEAEAAEARLLAAVRGREPGEPVLAAVRRYTLAGIERMCSGEDPWIAKMAPLLSESGALRRRYSEISDHMAHSLAEVIRHEAGARATDVRPYVTAQALLAINRAVVESAQRRLAAGADGRTLGAALRREAERAYALLEQGLGS